MGLTPLDASLAKERRLRKLLTFVSDEKERGLIEKDLERLLSLRAHLAPTWELIASLRKAQTKLHRTIEASTVRQVRYELTRERRLAEKSGERTRSLREAIANAAMID